MADNVINSLININQGKNSLHKVVDSGILEKTVSFVWVFLLEV